MVWSGAIWGVPKIVITNLKSTILRINKQEYLIAKLLSQTNPDEHVSMKINTCRIYKGGWGLAPQKQTNFKKKNQTKWRLFLIFFLFGKAPYIPKIMNLLPSSPKIITSAPQLPENK